MEWHGSLALQNDGIVPTPTHSPVSIEGAYKLYINGDGYPEIITLEVFQTKTEVNILSFNQKKNNWFKIYSDSTSKYFDGIEPLTLLAFSHQLTGDFKTQVFLGKISGSGVYLSFYAIGEDKNGNIKVILDRMDDQYPHGELLVDDLSDMKIYIKSHGEVIETLTVGDFAF